MLNGELGEYIDVIPAQQRVDERWYEGTADSILKVTASGIVVIPKGTVL